MSLLSDPEKNRYHRHLILDEIGVEGQIRIKNSRILVVGAGGLGCPVIQYLTATGVGTIGIIDNDQVDVSNLQRQVFYGLNDIGKMKAIVASSRMQRMNNLLNIIMINSRLTAMNALRIIAEYDLVVDCTDNLESRYIINDACIILDKPMVYGAVHKYQGQVSVFNYNGGPGYRCLFPFPADTGAAPPPIMGIYSLIPGIIGLFQANEAIKVVTGAGVPLSGRLMIYNAFENQYFYIDIEKNPENFVKNNLMSSFK